MDMVNQQPGRLSHGGQVGSTCYIFSKNKRWALSPAKRDTHMTVTLTHLILLTGLWARHYSQSHAPHTRSARPVIVIWIIRMTLIMITLA